MRDATSIDFKDMLYIAPQLNVTCSSTTLQWVCASTGARFLSDNEFD